MISSAFTTNPRFVMDISKLDHDQLVNLLSSLIEVMESRTHQRVHLGETITVKGSLPQALGLHDVSKKMTSSHSSRSKSGKTQFIDIWSTLSKNTQENALKHAGLFNPYELHWDDPRSNKYEFPEVNNNGKK